MYTTMGFGAYRIFKAMSPRVVCIIRVVVCWHRFELMRDLALPGLHFLAKPTTKKKVGWPSAADVAPVPTVDMNQVARKVEVCVGQRDLRTEDEITITCEPIDTWLVQLRSEADQDIHIQNLKFLYLLHLQFIYLFDDMGVSDYHHLNSIVNGFFPSSPVHLQYIV